MHRAVLCRSDIPNNHNKIKALLDQGASPAARTCNGDTPLHLILESYLYGYMLLVKDANSMDDRLFLLEENPFGSVHGLSHCHIACMFGNLEIVRSFLDRGVDPNLHRVRGPSCPKFCHAHRWHDETCLHLATHAGRSDVVQLLLEHGADPNARNWSLDTPLHSAEYDHHGSATKLLLEHGADVDARNCEDMTPLHVQCIDDGGFLVFHVVKALLEAGADINLVYGLGVSALEDLMIATFGYYLRMQSLVFEHAISLQEAGFELSNENLESIQEYEELEDVTDSMEYRKACRSELERINQVHLDARTTLRDALHVHDPRRLQRLAANEKFGRIVADEAAPGKEKTTFAIYGRLARLQYRRGVRIAEAVLALQKLCACIDKDDNGLPTECAEIIVYYLTYEELWRVIHAASR